MGPEGGPGLRHGASGRGDELSPDALAERGRRRRAAGTSPGWPRPPPLARREPERPRNAAISPPSKRSSARAIPTPAAAPTRRRWDGCTRASPMTRRRLVRPGAARHDVAEPDRIRGHARRPRRVTGGQRDADARRSFSRPSFGRTLSTPALFITCYTTTTTPSTRGWVSERPGPMPRSLPSRATASTCRRTSSSSLACGPRRRRRIATPRGLGRLGQAEGAHRPCAATTRWRGGSMSCSSWVDSTIHCVPSMRSRRS